VFDHTSVIKLIEKRFNIVCPTISPWRRAVAGDMTSAFDFDHPDFSWPDLPATKNYTQESIDQCLHLPYPLVPVDQSLPKQEPGVRISRALPYQFLTSDRLDFSEKTLLLSINNIGEAGGHFISYDLSLLGAKEAVKQFTVEGQKMIDDSPLSIQCGDDGSCVYGFHLLGPNGFFRQFSGSNQCSLHQAVLSYQPEEQTAILSLTNGASSSSSPLEFSVRDNAYGGTALSLTLSPGEVREIKWDLSSSSNWYDLTVTHADCFQRRFGGRMETGVDGISDPAMGAGVPDVGFAAPNKHPEVPKEFLILSRTDAEALDQKTADHKDAMIYWEGDLEVIS
jgi:phospholipase C